MSNSLISGVFWVSDRTGERSSPPSESEAEAEEEEEEEAEAVQGAGQG